MAGRKSKLTKAMILEGISNGRSITSICKGAGLVTKNTYFSWMRSDKKFRQAVRTAQKLEKHRRGNVGDVNVEESEGWIISGEDHKWQDVFFGHLKKTRDRVLAADKAGKNISVIMGLLDEGSSTYDKQFAKNYEEYQLREAVAIEDEAKKRAISGGSESMQKYLLPTLPIVGDKYRKAIKEQKESPIKIYEMIFSGSSRGEAYKKVKEIIDVSGQLTEG